MDALVRSHFQAKTWPRLVLLLAALFLEIGLPAQPADTLSVANQSTAAMKTFVIIFRQGPQPLTDADKKRRAEETATCARRQNSAGRRLSIPHFWARTMPGVRSSAGTRQTVNFWSIAEVNKCAIALMKCSFYSSLPIINRAQR